MTVVTFSCLSIHEDLRTSCLSSILTSASLPPSDTHFRQSFQGFQVQRTTVINRWQHHEVVKILTENSIPKNVLVNYRVGGGRGTSRWHDFPGRELHFAFKTKLRSKNWLSLPKETWTLEPLLFSNAFRCPRRKERDHEGSPASPQVLLSRRSIWRMRQHLSPDPQWNESSLMKVLGRNNSCNEWLERQRRRNCTCDFIHILPSHPPLDARLVSFLICLYSSSSLPSTFFPVSRFFPVSILRPLNERTLSSSSWFMLCSHKIVRHYFSASEDNARRERFLSVSVRFFPSSQTRM